jgi:hypothetical protein
VRPYDGHLISINPNGTYKGNVVADMQIMTAKAILDGLIVDAPLHQMRANKINQTLVSWAESGDVVYKPDLRCGGDSMHHVAKGSIVIRVENTRGVLIENNTISSIVNLSPVPYDGCVDLHEKLNEEDLNQRTIGNLRGISLSAVAGFANGAPSIVRGNRVYNLTSRNAEIVVGIDIQGESNGVLIKDNVVDLGVNAKENYKHLALRLRSFVQNVTVSDNAFEQDIQRLNTEASGTRRVLHPRIGRSTANSGGCPFAHLFGL